MTKIAFISLSLTLFGCDPGDVPLSETTSACVSDADCSNGFCGWEADNSRVCKAWSDVGEGCQGFVTPENRAFCDPSLVCVQNDPTFDLPGTCFATCTDDSDCIDGFCGADNSGNQVCKDFLQEGETCGGTPRPITPSQSDCDAGLFCYDDICTPTCNSGSDCDVSEFCGFREPSIVISYGGQRICKPRRTYDEECGGDVRPEDFYFCQLGLTCMQGVRANPGTCQLACTVDSDCVSYMDGAGGVCGFDVYQNRICVP